MEIAIIGAGITGLTTAIALQKQGLNCKIYEQAPELKAVGAGIWLQPNAIKVMDFLDLGDEIRSNGISLDKVDIADKNLHSFNINSSSIIYDQQGQKIISIHRATLQKILLKALDPTIIILNKKYKNHSTIGNKIEIEFHDTKIEADFLLAADGIHSKVRNDLFPKSSIRSANQICWRGIANYTLPTNLINVGRECWGTKVRFGFSQVSPKEVYWFVVISESICHEINTENLKDSLYVKFKDFHPIVNKIISRTKLEKIHTSKLSDLNRLKAWYRNNICLIGDAAHATTPNMGQGACQGIEDAYYLSKLLSTSTQVSEAFEQFEKNRRTKIDYVVNNSWRFGKMAHHPFEQFFMKWMMKATPERVIKKQLNKLYHIKGM